MPTVSTLVVDVQAKTSKFSTGMKTAVAGLGGLAIAASYAFSKFEESDKIAKQTDAVLKSTGGSANETAAQVSALADALSAKTGIDDETIQSGENLLLTFTNIRNEVGKGNDIFNQATIATNDMSAALGQDLKSSSIQLGKALNDPIKGITALRRVGVAFTDQQIKQITAMQKSGNLIGAQKIILGELTKEFGGSAVSQRTAAKQMQVSLENLGESVGRVLAPPINFLLELLTKVLGFLTRYPAALVAVGVAVFAVTAALIANNVATALAAEEGIVYAAVLAAKTAAHLATAAATGVATAAQWLFNVAVDAFPGILLVAAIIGIIAVIVAVVRHFHLVSKAMDLVGKAVHALGAVFGPVFRFVANAVGDAVSFIRRHWGLILAILTGPIGLATKFIIDHWQGILTFFRGLGGKLARAGGKMWDWLVSGIRAAVNNVSGILNSMIDLVNKFQIHVHVDPPGPGSINFDWSGLGIPHVPSLHRGGIVEQTGIALVHEGERFSGVGGWGNVTVNVAGSVIAERDLADTIQKALLKTKRRSGPLGLA